MSETETEQPLEPDTLPVMALLGLRDTDDGDFARMRGVQYAALPRMAHARLGLHAASILLVSWAFFGVAPLWLICGWAIGLGALLFTAFRFEASLADGDRRKIGTDETRKQAFHIGSVAVAWCVPMFFAPAGFGGVGEQMLVYAAIAGLIAFGALMLAAVPLSTLVFAGITGIGCVVALLLEGQFPHAITAAIFVGLASIGTIHAARLWIGSHLAEAGVAEKNEVVSLLLREFEENEADWLWQTDVSRRVRSVSPRFAFALGRQADEVDGMPFLQLIAGTQWETGQFATSLHDLAERLKRRESFSNLIVKVSINGESRWWELSGTPRLDGRGRFDGFRGVGSDVTEQRESSEKIAYMARYDTLTGLPNRLMVNETLGEAQKYALQWRSKCAFLMIDLDRFKAVNDSLGHQVGDRLLEQVASRLKQIVTENELCGRLGGDEFAVVIRETQGPDHVARIARNLINLLSQPYEVDNHTLYIGASVGSAIGPRDGSTVEELMRNADLALYRSKDEGGGEHFVYEPSLHVAAEERRQIEFSLRRALERNEMQLAFQPVVDANAETVASFEALLRWNSAEHGFVSPVKFIPIAEETRLIVPIGEWVLREACREAMQWPSGVRVNVNVSGEQLLDPNFANVVVGALSSSGLPPQRLEIEVTESIFLRDDTAARATLEELLSLGVRLALDDFGTGYSSLGYLRKTRFSTIKVDRSFVQGAAKGDVESLAIIRAVVAMADALEMSTTAEGVETSAEADLIRDMGCKRIQGFYFGRPMSAADARSLFIQPTAQRA